MTFKVRLDDRTPWNPEDYLIEEDVFSLKPKTLKEASNIIHALNRSLIIVSNAITKMVRGN